MPFSSLGLPEPIARAVRVAGYTEPTPIQRRAIPLILPGRDLVAAAQTGSGKTAAFLLPVLGRLLRGPRALRALVLVPTRELAAQVEQCARDYARFTNVRVGAVFGGVGIGPQERTLRHEGLDLLVATPGRLLDLHGRQSVSLDDIEVLVLDEADRMVDMGFAPDLRRILKLLPSRRQTLMFSATIPAELNQVASEALSKPQRLELAPPSRPAESIAQAIYPVPRHLKVELLEHLLGATADASAIVFARTKHGADRLGRQLGARGHAVAVLHGNRTQSQREHALREFKRGRVAVLVATDVASRGIDVDDVTHVVNHDVPRTPEDYVHRIGRTGRMNASGDAITLMCPEEREEVAAIERFLSRTLPRVLVAGFDYKRRLTERAAGPRPRPRRGTSGSGTSRGGIRSRGSAADPVGAEPRVAAVAVAPTHGRRPRPGARDRRSRRRM